MEPRAGIWGWWDRVVGPGATWVENAGTVTIGLLAGLLAPALLPGDASALQQGLAMALALDLGAGIWVTASPAGRRWYQRPSRPAWSRLAFVAAHGHPFVVAWAFGATAWGWAGALYVHAVAMTGLLLALPARLRTSTCLVGIAAWLAVEPRLESPLPWFGAAYLLKLLAGHGLPEVPGGDGAARRGG